jgi:3-oxoacyl-[acyl-carrier protein] reductase
MGRYGVTCNAVAPRARTRMTEGTFGNLPTAGGNSDVWHPRNVAPLVVFLAGPDGARYSGQIIVAGGGVTQLIAPHSVSAEMRFTSTPSPEEVGAFLSDTLGEQAAPPPFPDLGLTLAAS